MTRIVSLRIVPGHLDWAPQPRASYYSEADTRKLVVGCFSVALNPFFDPGFFVVVVRMMSFGVEPSQLDNFVDRP